MRLRHIPREASRLVRSALGFKPPPKETLARIVADLYPGDTFVDVGANVGLYALGAARKVGPTGTVLAIEPNPAVVARLEAASAGVGNVRIAAVAVGEAPGEATLHVFKHHTRSSILKDGRGNRYTLDSRNRATPVVVRVEPLLSILSRHGIEKIDALKIDIEGYEDRALIPFFNTAPKSLWPRRLLIELSPDLWKEDCVAYMEARGYRSTWRGRGDALLLY